MVLVMTTGNIPVIGSGGIGVDGGVGGVIGENFSVQGGVNPALLSSFFCSQVNSSEKSLNRDFENVSFADSDVNPMQNRPIIAAKRLIKFVPLKKLLLYIDILKQD